LIGCGIAALAGCATPPEKDPVQIRLNDLDTRLVRIERVVANQSLLELANEVEAARSDVRSLHNDFDQLSNSLAASRKQQKDLYADLDRRLRTMEARAAASAAASSGSAAAAAPAGSGAGSGVSGPGSAGSSVSSVPAPSADESSAGAAAAAGGNAAPSAGGAAAGAAEAPIAAGALLPVPDGNDRANYQAAFAMLKDSKYDQAVAAFQQFLVAFPDSSLADNAQYWLGEAYYVNRDFTDSLTAFQGLIDKYPQSRKLPDALLKVGYCNYELGRWDQSKKVLSEVVAKFSDTPAGHLAQQRLDKLAAEKH
jgi:tol-pal system protein YbgF